MLPTKMHLPIHQLQSHDDIMMATMIKGVVNCQNSQDKGPPEGNSARG